MLYRVYLKQQLTFAALQSPEGSEHPPWGHMALPEPHFGPTHIPWSGTRRAEEIWMGNWDECWLHLKHLPAVAVCEAQTGAHLAMLVEVGSPLACWLGRLVELPWCSHALPLTALKHLCGSPENCSWCQGKLPSHWRGWGECIGGPLGRRLSGRPVSREMKKPPPPHSNHHVLEETQSTARSPLIPSPFWEYDFTCGFNPHRHAPKT